MRAERERERRNQRYERSCNLPAVHSVRVMVEAFSEMKNEKMKNGWFATLTGMYQRGR